MDAVPDTRFGRKLTAFQCLCLRKVMWSKIGRDVEPNPAMRLVFRALSHLSDETVRHRYHQLVERAYKRDSQWVRILTFPTPNQEHGYLRTWYARSAPFVFEGYTFDGIADADDYLSFKFGDYLSFPPEEERRPSHPVSALRPAPDWEVIR
jgi:lipopolysaccharide cholinephosphotransferase